MLEKIRSGLHVDYSDVEMRQVRLRRVIPLTISPFPKRSRAVTEIHKEQSADDSDVDSYWESCIEQRSIPGSALKTQSSLDLHEGDDDANDEHKITGPSESDAESSAGTVEVGRHNADQNDTSLPEKVESASHTAKTETCADHRAPKKDTRTFGVPSDPAGSIKAPQGPDQTAVTYSDLFYDLFFVANLTIFADKSEVSSVRGMTRFMGFFGTLWLIYCHQTMFDVRFETWDMLNIILRLIQFGALAVFSATSRRYTTALVPYYAASFAVSKISLAFQYFIVWCWAHSESDGDAKAIKPLAIHVAVNVFAGVLWASSTAIEGSTRFARGARYAMWGGSALVEVLTHLFVGIYFEAMSFHSTQIIERIGLLGLLILGEGLVSIGDTAHQIAGRAGWTSTTILNFAAAVLIICLLFFLYYTNSRRTFYVSSWLMHFWIYTHFLLHLSVLLTVTGAGVVLQNQNAFSAYASTIDHPPDLPLLKSAQLASLQRDLMSGNMTAISLLTPDELRNFDVFENILLIIVALRGVIVPTYEEANILNTTTAVIADIRPELYEQFGSLQAIEVIHGDKMQITTFLKTSFFIFNFILTSAGIVLIFQAVICLLTESRRDRFSIYYAISRFILGLPLILFNILFVKNSVGFDFFGSGWTLPMLAAIFLLQAVIDQIIARAAVRRYVKHDLKIAERQAHALAEPPAVSTECNKGTENESMTKEKKANVE